MAIAPIANANLDLGPNPTGALAVPASSDAPGYCQLTGTVVTNNTTGKTANFAALLPENWNGKLLFQGCGGLCGVVFSGGVPGDELARGYAITATDDGHAANNSVFEAEWALTPSGEPNRDALVDVYYRAVHDVAITVKVLVTAWYSDELQHSYFEGCSGGGREAMVEAARYPSDFDGIIAGDPTFDYRGRTIRLYTTAKALLKSSGAYIDPRLLELVDRKIQQQCDASDGVKDGLIQNPAKCTFRAESLLCRNGNTAECLTEDQVGVLDHYLNAAKDERGLVASFGGPVSDIANSSLATDVEAAGPPVDIYAAEPWGDSPPTSWFAADNILRYLVYRDPDFNSNADFPMGFSNIIADPAIHLLDRRTEGLDGDDPSKLSTFLADGRKLILYQGYSDGRVSPFATIRFYENAARLSGGLKQLQKGARLFLEPGMYHCGGGPGPNSFDMLRALEGWVENQVGPDAIPAVKFVNDDPTMGVFRTMPLCKFPEAARYRGDGDVNDGLNWSCPSEDQSLLETGLDGDRAGLRLSVVPEKHEHGQTEHNDPRR
jgi:feruloyl esterase